MKKTIVLSGFMATGKTTVGKALASRIGVPFIDTDDVIAAAAGRSVPDLWRDEGEAAFRARERAAIVPLLAEGAPRVIALGGGSVTIEAVRRSAGDNAFVVTLMATPATISRRVRDVNARPNLAVGNHPQERAAELVAARKPAYAESHLCISTDAMDVDTIVEAIVTAAARDPLLVPLGERSYTVEFVRDTPARLTDTIALLAPSTIIAVTDSNVERARGAALVAALAPLAVPSVTVALAPGEAHKTLAAVATIWDAALGHGVDRDAVVVAFGGGVVGDLAGFAASALLRGVRLVQVPTTVLAMVDSSVGGKTGCDHPTGKNLIGAFHQPKAVLVDVAHLQTLNARERAAGLAEVVKIAVACDAHLLDRVESSAKALVAGDLDALTEVIRAAVAAKARVVRDDEREDGQRAVLNLGHTVGHALEAHGGFTKYLHGEAIAIGTVVELAAAAHLGHSPAELVPRVGSLLERLGLPVTAGRQELRAAWPFIASDKKRRRGRLLLPVVSSVGKSAIVEMELGALQAAVLEDGPPTGGA